MTQLQLKTDRMLAGVENGVGWITFNQPEKRNAVSYDMWKAIPEIFSSFAAGEHTDEVLEELGYDTAAIKKLHEGGVV